MTLEKIIGKIANPLKAGFAVGLMTLAGFFSSCKSPEKYSPSIEMQQGEKYSLHMEMQRGMWLTGINKSRTEIEKIIGDKKITLEEQKNLIKIKEELDEYKKRLEKTKGFPIEELSQLINDTEPIYEKLKENIKLYSMIQAEDKNHEILYSENLPIALGDETVPEFFKDFIKTEEGISMNYLFESIQRAESIKKNYIEFNEKEKWLFYLEKLTPEQKKEIVELTLKTLKENKKTSIRFVYKDSSMHKTYKIKESGKNLGLDLTAQDIKLALSADTINVDKNLEDELTEFWKNIKIIKEEPEKEESPKDEFKETKDHFDDAQKELDKAINSESTQKINSPIGKNYTQTGIDQKIKGLTARDYEQLFRKEGPKETITNAQSYFDLGSNTYNSGNFEDAVKYYNKVIELEPDNSRAYNNKGCALDQLNRLEEAIQCYDKAIALDPKNNFIYNNKGIVLKKQGKSEEAKKCFEKSKQLAENN